MKELALIYLMNALLTFAKPKSGCLMSLTILDLSTLSHALFFAEFFLRVMTCVQPPLGPRKVSCIKTVSFIWRVLYRKFHCTVCEGCGVFTVCLMCCCRPELTLGDRIEYISRAVMCAKSSNLPTATSQEGEFLHELEEKMEVSALFSLPLLSFPLLFLPGVRNSS